MTRWTGVGLCLLLYASTAAASIPTTEMQVDFAGDSASVLPIPGHPATQAEALHPQYAARQFNDILTYIQVNDHFIFRDEEDHSWVVSPLIPRMLRKSISELRCRLMFHKPRVDAAVMQSVVGHLVLRHGNQSAQVFTMTFGASQQSHTLAANVDLNRTLEQIQNLMPGSYSVQLRLDSSRVMDPLLVTLGDVLVPLHSLSYVQVFRLLDLLDGSLLTKFLERCRVDPTYEALLMTRLRWAQLLIAVFSGAYCAAVNWLGPLDFTRWQQRFYKSSCLSSAAFQLLGFAASVQLISIRVAFPIATVIGATYFITFNLTNVLILTERSDGTEGLDEITGIPIAIRRRRDRTFDSIPSSAQLHGMTRVVMVGYKQARSY